MCVGISDRKFLTNQQKHKVTRMYANEFCQTNDKKSRVAVGQKSMSDATDNDTEHEQ